jgi:hypothetical protein
MPDESLTGLPQPTVADHAHLAARAVISAIPVAGGPAAELFALVVASPLTKRRDAWLESLAEGLAKLAAKLEGFKIEALAENVAFISAMMQATQVALRTHHSQKLEALRNAVLNVALGRAPNENLQAIFLCLIDDFTPLHLQLLQLHREAQRYYSERFTELEFTDADFPWVPGQQKLCEQVIKDLATRGLLTAEDTWGQVGGFIRTPQRSSFGLRQQITELGEQFLDFVAPADQP